MSSRFSSRDLALLTAPVLLLGALGFWLSKRPHLTNDETKWKIVFHLDTPTVLETFQGYEGAFVVEAKDPTGKLSFFQSGKPYLEFKAQSGVETSRFEKGDPLRGVKVWGGNTNNSRFTFKLGALPAGTLYFGYHGITSPSLLSTTATSAPPVKLSGKWKVDRATIHTPSVAQLPPKPFVSVRAVTITAQSATTATGEIEFQLEGAAMDKFTSLETSFSSDSTGMSWGDSTSGKHNTARTRVLEWRTSRTPGKKLIKVSGRVSAGKHWPLGFEIEPFDCQRVKVGQKLKFKQFRVTFPSPN